VAVVELSAEQQGRGSRRRGAEHLQRDGRSRAVHPKRGERSRGENKRERGAIVLERTREIWERERERGSHHARKREGHMGCLVGWASPFVTPFFPFLFSLSINALS